MALNTWWSNKTLFESGVILALLVLIPFIIACVLIFGVFGTNSRRPCKEEPTTTTQPPTPYVEELCHDAYGKIEYPFVVPVIEQLYTDEKTDVILRCLAIQVSKTWLVANGACFKNVEGKTVDLKPLSVRLGSHFWSKGGTCLQVVNVSFQDPAAKYVAAALRIKVPDPTDPCLQPVKLSRISMENPEKGQSFKWAYDLKLPFGDRYKFHRMGKRKLDLTKFGDEKCPELENPPARAICGTDVDNNCDPDVPAPVIDDENKLLAIHVLGDCQEPKKKMRFVYQHVYGFKNWLRDIGALK